MVVIKFSHVYLKMLFNTLKFDNPPSSAILLGCFRSRAENLAKKFIEYDTVYWDSEKKEYQFYYLPKGELIVLLLLSGDKLWTTIRSYNPEKWMYYNRYVGKSFDIKIENVRCEHE